MGESKPRRRMPPLKYMLIPTLSVAGIGLAAYTVSVQVPKVPSAPLTVAPPKSPFDARISGIGTVLPAGDVVSVGTAIAGVIEEVVVTEGQSVRKGDLLFRIDSRQTVAEIAVAKARLAVAKGELASVKALPRSPALQEAQAGVMAAEAQVADSAGRLSRLTELGPAAATSANERPRLEFELASAQAALAKAMAHLAEVKQGAWPEDLAVAAAQVDVATAELERLQTQLERESVRAPMDATVLYVDIDAGEHVVPGSMQQMVALGVLDPLHVRVQIDEMDAWRFSPDAHAVAMPRGGAAGSFELKYVRMAPLVIPKHLLSGDSTERIDVRVMEVEYEMPNPGSMSMLPGQVVDVFIEVGEPDPVKETSPASQ